MAALFRKLFRRKKQPPLVCAVELDSEGNPIGEHPDHVHTDACFIPFDSLAVGELFMSQSCAATPGALPGALDATADPNVLLLTQNVTLFDHTGWKDTLSSNAADLRHRAYAKKWARTSLFTPQLVVNGTIDGSGPDKDSFQGVIGRGRELQDGKGFNIFLDANDTDIKIDTDRQEAPPHDIFRVAYEPNEQSIKVGKGPNKGKKMVHRNIVREVKKIGEWRGGNLVVPLELPRSAEPRLGVVYFIQEGTGGPIVAAVKG